MSVWVCMCLYVCICLVCVHMSVRVSIFECGCVCECGCVSVFASCVCLHVCVLKTRALETGGDVWRLGVMCEMWLRLPCCQLQQEQDQGISDAEGLTMKRLVVWTFDPILRLKTLAALVDACKGGCLFSTHGVPQVFVKITAFWQPQELFSRFV